MRTALYRHFDADGQLLYVGITDALVQRDKAHAKFAVWHQFVARSETQWFDGRKEAMTAETRAILQERPIYNRMSTIKSDATYGEIGARLVQLRADHGLTQSEFSKMIGVKRSRYSIWECGAQRLSLDGALTLHHVLGTSLDWLFLGEPSQ